MISVILIFRQTKKIIMHQFVFFSMTIKKKKKIQERKEKEKNDNNNSRILLTPYCSLLIFDNQFPSVL